MTDRSSPSGSSMCEGQVASPLGAMATLLGLGGLCGCPLEGPRALEGMGWNVQRLGTLHDIEDEVLGGVLHELEGRLGHPVEAEVLIGLIEVCHAAADVAWRIEGKTSGAELLVAHEQKKLQDKLNEWREFSKGKVLDVVPLKGTAKVTRWPTRLQRKLNEAGDNQALRESAEKQERVRWIRELKNLLLDGRCPAVQGEDPGRDLSRRFGKGRRVNTLRKHVKTWEKVAEWMLSTFRHSWPEEPMEFALYLEARANEPCGRSIPSSVFKTLMFMENAGEIPPEKQLCKSPAIRNVLEEVNMQLAENSGGFTRKAWHLPVRIVAEMEAMVMDVSSKEYTRCYAWYRLVKVWTGMRFSDTCGMLESSVDMTKFGLTAILAKTKTTGPGKKIQHLRVWVNDQCWIKHRHWLEVGFDIWNRMGRESGLHQRDFGLPCPAKDLRGFVKRPASYAIASQCSQALFNSLQCEYEGSEVPLLAIGVGVLWTEHSERTTMRTWADAAKISPEVKKQMGRWLPTTDQAYERTCRANVLSAQEKMASFIRGGIGRRDVFDEASVFAALTEKMESMEFPKGAIEVQIDKLQVFGKEPTPKRIRLTPNGPIYEDAEDAPRDRRLEDLFGDESDVEPPQVEWEYMEDDEKGVERIKTPSHGNYILSVVGRSQTKTLHRMGECHRVPGVHYSKFEVIGDNPPAASQFHRSCLVCFPRGTGAGEEESSGEADDVDVTSSDSSTSVENSSDDD